MSEHPERFFVSEIVREKIFMQYRNEIPYACQVKNDKFGLFSPVKSCGLLNQLCCYMVASTPQVNVLSYKTRPAAKDFIQVEVVVDKNSQKIILIGKVSVYNP